MLRIVAKCGNGLETVLETVATPARIPQTVLDTVLQTVAKPKDFLEAVGTIERSIILYTLEIPKQFPGNPWVWQQFPGQCPGQFAEFLQVWRQFPKQFPSHSRIWRQFATWSGQVAGAPQ